MFDKTWRWAGRFRSTEKNIGVDASQISTKLADLLGDVEIQLENTAYPLDEIAARFHHRLVSIHPFANGNGRFSRTMTDLLLIDRGSEAFTWGRADLMEDARVRERYIEALREADIRNYKPLLDFVRSE